MPERMNSQSKRSSRSTSRGTRATRRRRQTSAVPVAVAKSGAPITEELAERLAREAEDGYDLSRGQRIGRRSLSGGGRSPRLNIRTPVDLYEKALAKATREGKTVSQLAREALEKYIK